MSEVSICNVALSYLGEDTIRSLDEDTRRAGLCNLMYPIARDALLSRQDWSFARKTLKLQQLSEDYYEGAVFALPADCLTPLNILPRLLARRQNKIEGGRIVFPGTDASESLGYDLYLQYTFRCTDTTKFSASFIDVLALDLAVRMCLPLTQDSKLAQSLRAELRVAQMENGAEDANRGDEWRYPDEDPNYDSFVNPPED